MTTRTVKVGDKFKLCGFIWQVTHLFGDTLGTFEVKQVGANMNILILTRKASEAMGCEWIEPEVRKLTKEQAEMIKGKIEPIAGTTLVAIDPKWLDSITE